MAVTVIFTKNNLKILPKPMNTVLTIFTGDCWERLGYQVITVPNGKGALEIYRRDQSNIDMVILDMIMPDMSGEETYNRLKRINPSIKTLLSSGYSINGKTQAILNRGCNGFIQKPFNLTSLSQKVRKVLDQK
jgi:CheY-like chemotaxis protein